MYISFLEDRYRVGQNKTFVQLVFNDADNVVTTTKIIYENRLKVILNRK